jgi:hypothetical protein
MNVRIDYTRIAYWQSAMGADRVAGTRERLPIQEAQSQARPSEVESLQERPPVSGSEPVRDSGRRPAVRDLPRSTYCPKIWRSQAGE